MKSPGQHERLREFIHNMNAVVEQSPQQSVSLQQGCEPLLSELIRHDDWLPRQFAQADPDRYQQNLLYCDLQQRFCIVSFVWGPAQTTPIHDHKTWGVIGVLQGEEQCTEFSYDKNSGLLACIAHHLPAADANRLAVPGCAPSSRFDVVSTMPAPTSSPRSPAQRPLDILASKCGEQCRLETESHILQCGEIDRVSPQSTDIHRVSNALHDGVSISIHVYGSNIGEQSRFIYQAPHSRQAFISGYSNSVLPNIWNEVIQ